MTDELATASESPDDELSTPHDDEDLAVVGATPGAPISPRRSGAHLDRLAQLEEERRFLLRSLDDLEREHGAGDVDDVDYETLRDGYTVRAAAVLRQLDAGRAQLAPKRPRRWGRTLAVSASVLALAVAIGFTLAGAFGERTANQEMTGIDPGNNARTVLASARDALNTGDLPLANALFARVVQMERERGVDSAEAITYFGWTLALVVRSGGGDITTDERLDAARLALSQAAEIDPDYADPNCFLAIIEFRFLDDADAALPYVDACESNNPPAEMSGMIGAFADDIRAAAD